MKGVIFFYIMILATVVQLTGQRAAMDEEIRELFSDENAGIWIRYYKGKVNDLDNVVLAIGHDKKEYRGFYRYLKSGQTYFIHGQVGSTNIEWIESLDKKVPTGILKGHLTEEKFTADRWNIDETFIQSFDLDRLKKVELSQIDCSEGLWLRTFEGSVLDDDAKIILQKEPEGQLKGVIQFNNKISTYNLEGYCIDDSCNQAKIWLSNNYGKDLGYFIMNHLELDQYEIILNRSADKKSEYRISLMSENEMHCVTYRGSSIAYNYIFPILENGDFNEWILSHYKKWLTPLLKLKDSTIQTSIMENQEMAISWMDVEYMGPKLISGFITFYHPANNLSQRESFIYRFKRGGNITWTSLFKDLSGGKKKIKYFIQQEKEKMRFKESELAYEWISEEPFDDVCIRKDGLCFATNFNGIFGERKIIVPYGYIKPYLKSKRFILKL